MAEVQIGYRVANPERKTQRSLGTGMNNQVKITRAFWEKAFIGTGLSKEEANKIAQELNAEKGSIFERWIHPAKVVKDIIR